ncbi:hypothetical protein D3C80_1401520 [compost metagenome]
MLALGFVGGADGHQAAQLAVRAGLGRQGHRRHARQGRQPMGQLVHQLQRALNRRLRLQRVDVREAGQTRHLLVQTRVVLHRARAQRIDGQIDGVVLLAQAHIVAHGLGLGQAGQTDRVLANQVAQVRAVGGGLGQIDAGLVPAVAFEDQSFVLQQAARARQGRVLVVVVRRGVRGGRAADVVHGAHASISPQAARTLASEAARILMSASSVVSVAATSRTSSRPASGARRL